MDNEVKFEQDFFDELSVDAEQDAKKRKLRKRVMIIASISVFCFALVALFVFVMLPILRMESAIISIAAREDASFKLSPVENQEVYLGVEDSADFSIVSNSGGWFIAKCEFDKSVIQLEGDRIVALAVGETDFVCRNGIKPSVETETLRIVVSVDGYEHREEETPVIIEEGE
jgi:hypothetical protein